MKFVKAHAYGNDFLYVRQADAEGAQLVTLARAMCDRHTGVGADGLIIYDAVDDSRGVSIGRDDTITVATGGSAIPGTPSVSMRLFNADGSRAEVSGNGVRALAALLLQHDNSPEADVVIRTEAGAKRLTRTERSAFRQTFRADMGAPVDVRQVTMSAAGESLQAVTLNMGNPQCVVLGDLPDQPRFLTLGRALERHDLFPEGTNVEFTHVEAPDRLRMLIWERGVGPTASSGTGSCAALVAAAAYGGANRDAEVIAPGGSQRVEWRADSVYLTGWAEVICGGDWLLQIPRTQ